MKTYREVEVLAAPFLILALDAGEWLDSFPGCFTLGGGDPLNKRLGGPQSWSGHCGIKKNFLPLLGIIPWPSSQQPVAIPTELSRLSRQVCIFINVILSFTIVPKGKIHRLLI
jgi:hypothetical protein